MGGRSSVTRKVLGSIASVGLVLSAFLWITSVPGAGAKPGHPDLSAHQRRYEQRFNQIFKNASPQVRLEAQRRYQEAFLNSWQPAWDLAPQGETPCVDGHAGQWPCKGFDLLSYLPMSALGGGESNDVWGWTDPLSGKEYALLGRTNGTAFVDISDPTNPVYLGNLPSWQGYESSWRAIKVYQNYPYLVADAIQTGMELSASTKLRTVTNPPVTFTADFHYNQMSNTHTLAVNEET